MEACDRSRVSVEACDRSRVGVSACDRSRVGVSACDRSREVHDTVWNGHGHVHRFDLLFYILFVFLV